MTALSLDGSDETGSWQDRTSCPGFVHHPEMNWPDTLAWGPDNALYVVSNHLHVWVDGNMNFTDPDIPNFRIWKIENVGASYTQ